MDDDQGCAQDEERYKEVMKTWEEPAVVQERTLKYILSKNAETEYLLKFGLGGATDAETFRKNVPVSGYDDYKPFVDRVLKGDEAPLLATEPVTEIWSSSGTSQGLPKLYAMTDEAIAQHATVMGYHFAVMKRCCHLGSSLLSLYICVRRGANFWLRLCEKKLAFREGLRKISRTLFKTNAVSLAKHDTVRLNDLLDANHRVSTPICRHMPVFKACKTLRISSMRGTTVLEGGLPCHPFTTAAVKSRHFREVMANRYSQTSPREVSESSDYDSSMYCHVLLGLLQRDEVGRITASFPPSFIGAMKCLKKWWPEICDDIANGSLSDRIEEESIRSAVLAKLRKDPNLAGYLRKEFCELKSWNGIVQKLWPNVEMIDISCNASMEAYFSIVTSYAGNVPVMYSGLYGSTEMCTGLNLNPLRPANKSLFTLVPACAYFEFIPVAESNHYIPDSDGRGVVLDLMRLQEGREYELLVTTIGGLYRYRVGDVLKVEGFYKSNPTFKFVRRMNVILSVDTDKTDESDLQSAVDKGCAHLERELGLRLLDYTSCVDCSSHAAGHYVIFLELALLESSSAASLPERFQRQSVLERCCEEMEGQLSRIYRRGRHENIIGALELRVVEEGSFDLLARDATTRGASAHQFKTPRGMPAASTGVAILNARVIKSALSQKRPPFPSLNAELLQ